MASASDVAQLRSLLGGRLTGVVVVTGPPTGGLTQCGRDYVSQLVGIARELAELPGEPPRLFVVTRSAASVLPSDLANLEQAGLRGLMRVIDSEHPHLGATAIDVDNDETVAALVASQLQSGSQEDETAWRNGIWYTARLRPGPLRPAERRTAVVEYRRDGMRLQIRTPGDLESLEFVTFDRVAPGPGEIEVAVTASSVNFADVLVAFGRYPTFEGYRQQLGIDFAGVVTAVGPDVTEHRIGDHVGGMSANGCWSTFVRCDARLAVTLPPELPVAAAAAVPTASATAWYALHDLARICSDDKVLIHSGTGGVGQAAIAIARAAGCEIFATAGSAQRRQLLHDMGVEHVYDSRSTEFAEQIRGDTDGYGVDVVLNSLPGAAQRAGIELLAFGGRFVEIGKRDIYGDTRLGLFPFRRNLSLYAVDLALLTHSHPHTVRRLLKTVYQHTVEGTLPVPQTTHYPIHDAAVAIRLVGGAGHTGKVVLDVPRTGEGVAVVPPNRSARPGPTAPISSPVVWAASACSLPASWRRRAADASCSTPVRRPARTPPGSSSGSAPPVLISRWNAVTSLMPQRPTEWWRWPPPGLAGARRAARGGGGRGRYVGQCHRRTYRPLLGAEGTRRVEHSSGHRRAATGVVLLVLLGRGLGGLAGSRRICGGQQLVGRFCPLAAGAGPSGYLNRLGSMGRDWPRYRAGRRHRRSDRARRGCSSLPDAASLRPGVLRLCPDHGYPMVDGLCAT